MGDFSRDVRHALRVLSKHRGFTTVAVLTLAIGIGAATSIFSVVNAVLLRPLPYPDAGRIVRVRPEIAGPADQVMNEYMTNVLFDAWSDTGTTLEQIAAYNPARAFSLRVGDRVDRVRGASVSPAMFPLLRTAPQLGRLFLPEEAARGANPVVLLSDRMWRTRFASDPNVVGQLLPFVTQPRTIVGVLPPEFYFPDRETLFWTPMSITPPPLPDGGQVTTLFSALARVRAGLSIEQAEAEGVAIRQGLNPDAPDASTNVALVPLQEELVADTRPAMLVLFAAVLAVLLLVVVNLTNLLLARGLARERELTVRAAVGASRGRLMRQLLTESLTLSVIGGGLGLLAAYWGLGALLSLAPAGIPRIAEVTFDPMVVGFAIGLSLLSGLLTGSLPAFGVGGITLAAGLALGGVGPGLRADGGAARARTTLVAAQFALALILAVTAGLLVRSFSALVAIDPGYDPAGVLTAQLNVPVPDPQVSSLQLSPEERRARAERDIPVFDEILQLARGLPGVRGAGVTSLLPMVSGGYDMPVNVVGQPMSADQSERPRARLQVVSPNYHRSMGIRLVSGRLLTGADRTGTTRVALVNETFARRHLQDGPAVGRRGCRRRRETRRT